MSIHYKFKSMLDFDTITFDGLHISVSDLKKAIFQQKKIGKNTDFDLKITNAQTKEDYLDNNTLIAKNTSLIIARVPLTAVQKRSQIQTLSTPVINTTKDAAGITESLDLSRLDVSEEDKIQTMISQSTQDYDPSNYLNIKGSNQVGEVPANYRCFKCHQTGHWIKNCPLGATKETVIEVKKSKGIPASFMVPVEGPQVPGAMMTSDGNYAVPAIAHETYKEGGKKEKPAFIEEITETQIEKPEIDEELICNICKDLLTDAVMVPCCGNSFCDECIRTLLLESEDHECPDCNEKDVSPESLLPNRYLRSSVLKFKNETGYSKPETNKPLSLVKIPNSLIESVSEVSTSEKLATAARSFSENTSASSLDETSVKEAEKSLNSIKTSLIQGFKSLSTAAALPDSGIDPDSLRKPIIDYENEVPPPPGTEPLILLRKIANNPRKIINTDSKDKNVKSSEIDQNSLSKESDDTRDRFKSTDTSKITQKNIQSHTSGENSLYPIHEMNYESLRRATQEKTTPTVDDVPVHSSNTTTTVYTNQSMPTLHNPNLITVDPYTSTHTRMPMYPQQPPHNYGHIPRYERPFHQTGYRHSNPRHYQGHPRTRGVHGSGILSSLLKDGVQKFMDDLTVLKKLVHHKRGGYRGMHHLQNSLSRSYHNGSTNSIDDPLEAFQRILREKDERNRRLSKHRRRSRSRSYSRSSISPPKSSRSPQSLHKRNISSRSSGSFTMSRSRSYSRSPSPKSSNSSVRYKAYYGETADYQNAYHDRSQYAQTLQQPQMTVVPPLIASPHVVGAPIPTATQMVSVPQQIAVMGHIQSERKDYYDSYNRYPVVPQPQLYTPHPGNRYDDVAPPGTEGYYDVAPTGLDHLERPTLRTDIEQSKDQNGDRYKDDRDRYSDKSRKSDRDRRDHDYDKSSDRHRHDRSSSEKKKSKKSSSPYPSKYKDAKDSGSDKSKKKDKEEKSKDKQKEKKIKDKRKRKGTDEKDKRKKKKKEKKSGEISQKDVIAAAAAAAAAATNLPLINKIKVKQEPDSDDDKRNRSLDLPLVVTIKTEPGDESKTTKLVSKLIPPPGSVHKTASREPFRKILSENFNFRPAPIQSEIQENELRSPEYSEDEEAVPNENEDVEKGIEEKVLEEQIEESLEEHNEENEEAAEERDVEGDVGTILGAEVEIEAEADEQNSDNFRRTSEAEDDGEVTLNASHILDHTNISASPKSQQEYGINGNHSNNAESLDGKDEEDVEDGEVIDEGETSEASKRRELLTLVPEPSRWERDTNEDKLDDYLEINTTDDLERQKDPPKRLVTTEVLKRAENAIFRKAINAIRPMEVKKPNESRKILYQNQVPKESPERDDDRRKNVNVTINVNKNKRNVEITNNSSIKRLNETRSNVKTTLSSAVTALKDQFKDKQEKESKTASLKSVVERRNSLPVANVDSSAKEEVLESIVIDDDPIIPNPQRRVIVGSRKRVQTATMSHRKKSLQKIELQETMKILEKVDLRQIEKLARNSPRSLLALKSLKDVNNAIDDKRKDKRLRGEKKMKKDDKIQSVSSDLIKRKDRDRNHKRIKEKNVKFSREPEVFKEKPIIIQEKILDTAKKFDLKKLSKKKKNSKLVSGKRKSESADYSESDSDSEDNEKASYTALKRAKLIDSNYIESALKKRQKKQSSSDDDDDDDDEFSSSESSSSESDSSEESRKKKKKKHKKRKKSKVSKKDSSSDSEIYTISSDSSSIDEKHKKKKKSKNKVKQLKKKKKSKYK